MPRGPVVKRWTPEVRKTPGPGAAPGSVASERCPMGERFRNGQFVGILRDAVEVSGLTLAETAYAPGAHVPAHAHDHALCCLILEGSFTERCGATVAPCGPGTLIFHPQDEPHAHDFDRAGARCFNVQFGAAWSERVDGFGLARPSSPQRLDRTRAGWLASQLYEEFRTRDDVSRFAIEGLTLALLADITRSRASADRAGAKPRWLRRAVDRLHADASADWSLAELAADVEIDPTHLARTFRAHYGCSIGEYVRKRRVDAARHQLLRTTRSLAEIAIATGFADQAHFSRVFKRVTGCSPGAFRRSAR